MEAEGIGDDEGIGRNREGAWRGKTQRCQFSRLDAKRALSCFDVGRLASGEAHPPFPGKALPAQPVRAGYIGKGSGVFGDIGQKQPRLDRRVKGIGVQQGLRIGRSGAGMAQNALHPYYRFGVTAAGVTHEPPPVP